ncbi:DNA-binding transcriptional regulator YhcF (GntR family) [Virgibacillus halotolerans]|uniref:GntR family transcriptional regulator n=1 Tax=Virgibacillus halotolerans TaxID=1071053 RepID=UPI0019617173|nr:GntR family transcriptional regulator [Virgibacillus halotolerans]MBM7599638.1 DNA-binding transcriptional regulator YhcF (GntR family) [Virgibacillus halotolerans]
MMLHTDRTKPIYIQIAEWIETEVLNGNFAQDEKVYSQYKLAEMFTINPATAAKGLNLLADEGILYNKRGLGKFVTKQAKAIITDKRKNQTLKGLIEEIVVEAGQLDVSEEELIDMLQTMYKNRKGDAK